VSLGALGARDGGAHRVFHSPISPTSTSAWLRADGQPGVYGRINALRPDFAICGGDVVPT
jgi:hypothetical protein